METILVQADNPEQVKLVQAFLGKNKLKSRGLFEEDKEDIVLGRLMEETDHNKVIDANGFIDKLRGLMELVVTKQFSKDVEKEPDKALQIQLADIIEQLIKATALQQIADIKKLKGYAMACQIKLRFYRLDFLYESNRIVLSRARHKRNL